MALNAKGAATASAVTVDSDSASRNRLPPDGSSGRCRYMANQVGLGGGGGLLVVFYPNSPIDVGLRDKSPTPQNRLGEPSEDQLTGRSLDTKTSADRALWSASIRLIVGI